MTTFRRFECVERSIAMFLDQDFTGQIELIIYNTDTEYPLELYNSLKDRNIKVINNNTNYQTGLPYDNVGDIRRDATTHAAGKYYICWDDDDVFLPWNISQCYNGIINVNVFSTKYSWKPKYSMWWPQNKKPEIAQNVMEASMISELDAIRNVGFNSHLGGGEHLKWVNYFQDKGYHIVDPLTVPAYSFNWHDEGVMRGHKQSGSIDRIDNFEFHKANTKDFATRPLEIYPYEKLIPIYKEHVEVIQNNMHLFNQSIYDFYIKPHESFK
jgi:hypothetical protein